MVTMILPGSCRLRVCFLARADTLLSALPPAVVAHPQWITLVVRRGWIEPNLTRWHYSRLQLQYVPASRLLILHAFLPPLGCFECRCAFRFGWLRGFGPVPLPVFYGLFCGGGGRYFFCCS